MSLQRIAGRSATAALLKCRRSRDRSSQAGEAEGEETDWVTDWVTVCIAVSWAPDHAGTRAETASVEPVRSAALTGTYNRDCSVPGDSGLACCPARPGGRTVR